MDSRYTLLFSKGSGSVVNSFTQWGIVCCQVPFKAGGETKDVAVRDYPDEHGEYAFIPKSLKMKAYDAEFELAYSGKELATNPFNLSLAYTNIKSFKAWLTGNDDPTNHPDGTGAELSIYSPFATIGRQGCYLLEIYDEEPRVMTKYENGNNYNENVVTFKVKFRVTDPMTDVDLSTSS